jgi:4-oxalmesaconate hydratase
MIIDCHGHYTTAPREHEEWRRHQVAAKGLVRQVPPPPAISDDAIRASIEQGQLRVQRERGTDLTIFSPKTAAMDHHAADSEANIRWAEICNTLICRICRMFPRSFVGVCQLPQAPGVPLVNCIPELERCVRELGFVGCNINPDPCGGYWTDPPLTDRWWYPLYERLVDLDLPGMIHVSSSCNPNFHATGAHYLNGDTTAFMQFLTSDLFDDFSNAQLHNSPWRWRGSLSLGPIPRIGAGEPRPLQKLLENVFFDTCVYHQPGTELLARVIPVENILFASEMIGAVRGLDPETGHHYDDTRCYIEAVPWLTDIDREMIFEGNARRVYPRLRSRLELQSRL